MTSKPTAYNAIQLEVLWTRLISIVDEAAKAIVRTAFSTLSNEANDFACVLTDACGRSLAQNSGSIPSFIATLPATVRHFLDHIPPFKVKQHLHDVRNYLKCCMMFIGTLFVSEMSPNSEHLTRSG